MVPNGDIKSREDKESHPSFTANVPKRLRNPFTGDLRAHVNTLGTQISHSSLTPCSLDEILSTLSGSHVAVHIMYLLTLS